MKRFGFALAVLVLAACGDVSNAPTAPAEAPAPPPAVSADGTPWSAPNSDFEAVEPTIFGIIGAATVWDALAPIGRSSLESTEGSPGLKVNVRAEGEGFVADVIRSGLADDAVGDEHVRIEFRREVDGWYPTNAYRRHTCRRAADPEQWSTNPCP